MAVQYTQCDVPAALFLRRALPFGGWEAVLHRDAQVSKVF